MTRERKAHVVVEYKEIILYWTYSLASDRYAN
jgi:hypothetical protein